MSATGVKSRGIDQGVSADEDEFIQLRRHIHAHPEIGADVHATAALVVARIRAYGFEVFEGIGGAGVVGRLKRGGGRRSIGLRAEMDALPIQEQTGLGYASRLDGAMHACGHDGHVAILLAAAKQLARHVTFDGTLHLIFQPDEENLSGALRMMEDGLFDRFPCDALYALHNLPGMPAGQFIVQEGPLMAASDVARITLSGEGGHSAMPERARDPIVAAASIVMALQSIVSRNIAAADTGVLTVSSIHGGAAHNVIPSTVDLVLNIRTTDPDVRQRMSRRVDEIVRLQAKSFDVSAEIDYRHLVPLVLNAPEPTGKARATLTALVGAENVRDAGGNILASEDFAWMSTRVPACYVMAGNGTGAQGGCSVHNPGYDFNDSIVGICATYWINLVRACLSPT